MHCAAVGRARRRSWGWRRWRASPTATRVLCFEQGADWAVSEMLSAKGWVFSGRKTAAPRSF